MKKLLVILGLLILSSCFVTKKKYDALEQEIASIKSDLKDDDRDGVPNYLDKEANTDSLVNVNTKGQTVRIVKIVDMDEDGVLDVNDFCPTIKGIASANGCPDFDKDGIYDFQDKCPKVFGYIKEEGCPHDSMRVIDKIFFQGIGFLKFTEKTVNLNAKNKTILDSLMKQAEFYLTRNKEIVLQLFCYTDSIGDSLKNVQLTEKRGKLIKDKLIKKGINPERVVIFAQGSRNPKYANDTKEGRQANNRIEFFVGVTKE